MLPFRSLGSLFLLLAIGCETLAPEPLAVTTPNSAAVFLPVPEAGFHLPPSEREKVHPAINTHVLERLLARVRPEYRADILQFYQEIGKDKPVAFGPIISNTGDPELDSILKDLSTVTTPDQLSKP